MGMQIAARPAVSIICDDVNSIEERMTEMTTKLNGNANVSNCLFYQNVPFNTAVFRV